MHNKGTPDLFGEIILPLALPKCFTYSIPVGLHEKAAVGKRVIVQFGKKKMYAGLIYQIHSIPPEHVRVKPVIDVLDETPILHPLHFSFWNWISDYYMCSLGEIMKAAIPSGLRLESETILLPDIAGEPDQLNNLQKKEILLYEWLLQENQATLNKILQAGFSMHSINKLIETGIIQAEEKLIETYKPKTKIYVTLHEKHLEKSAFNKLFDVLSKAPKQLSVLLTYLKLSEIQNLNKPKEVEKNILIKESNTSNQILQSLIKKAIFTTYQKTVDRLLVENEKATKPAIVLNEYQQKALHEIINSFREKNTVLLHGITSSGKTEIYIHLINEQILQNKQVLYLLPEIALTTQIIVRLKAVFGDIVGVYHSKFSSSERTEIWQKIGANSKYKIILGVRSSVFIPFQNLGLVIVDEEHETTYKQFDPAPRYHARDCAIYLASLHKAKVLLGTATPSVESYYNASNKKYGLVNIEKRYKNILLPLIELVDTYEARRKKQMISHFSKRLIEEIQTSLENKEQVILFQNRRGYSPFYQCDICGWIPYCPNCNVSLTYHKFHNTLDCHYCGYQHKKYSHCKACESTSLSTKGFGTEKIEDEVMELFPSAVIKRLDLDTTRKKNAYEDIIGRFENGSIDILIGTQMISKGLNFNNVNLVGILNADNLLNFPDFRAFERSFQLLSQVAGRAGRSKKQGKVIIQTSMTDHDILQNVLNNEYILMYENQLVERKNYQYPPYYKLIKLSIKDKNEEKAHQASRELYLLLSKKLGNRILPPNTPLIDKINHFYIKQILIKIERNKSFQLAKNIIRECEKKLLSIPKYKNTIIISDVDPF